MNALDDETLALFNAYYDDELPPDERAEFEQQLADEPELREDYDRFAQSLDALSSMEFEVQEAPPDLLRNVSQAIRKESRGAFFSDETWFGNYRVPFELIILIGLVLLGALYLLGQRIETESITEIDSPEEEMQDKAPEKGTTQP